MKRIMLVAISLITLIGCRKDNSIVIENPIFHQVQNVSYILKNDIYFLTDFNGGSEQITHSAEVIKTNVKMSYDYQKFAYLNSEGIVEIVNRSGQLIAVLSNYTEVKSFDWSADSKTLWMLNDNDIVFYGPEMNLPGFVYPPTVPSGVDIDILLMAISKNGDMAYCYNWSGYDSNELTGQWWQIYGHGFVRIYNDNNQTMKYSSGDGSDYSRKYLQFSSNKQDLILGFGNEEVLSKIELYKGYDFYSSYQKEGNFTTPIYRSDLNILLYPQTTDETVPLSKIHAENLTSGRIEINDELKVYNSILHIDWK